MGAQPGTGVTRRALRPDDSRASMNDARSSTKIVGASGRDGDGLLAAVSPDASPPSVQDAMPAIIIAATEARTALLTRHHAQGQRSVTGRRQDDDVHPSRFAIPTCGGRRPSGSAVSRSSWLVGPRLVAPPKHVGSPLAARPTSSVWPARREWVLLGPIGIVVRVARKPLPYAHHQRHDPLHY